MTSRPTIWRIKAKLLPYLPRSKLGLAVAAFYPTPISNPHRVVHYYPEQRFPPLILHINEEGQVQLTAAQISSHEIAKINGGFLSGDLCIRQLPTFVVSDEQPAVAHMQMKKGHDYRALSGTRCS
jgi:hypothetical protein